MQGTWPSFLQRVLFHHHLKRRKVVRFDHDHDKKTSRQDSLINCVVVRSI